MSEPDEIIKLFAQLCEQPTHSFPDPGGSVDAPSEQGTYIIRDPQGQVAHVGRTQRGQYGLAQRLHNHLHAKSSFVWQYLKGDGKQLRVGYTFQYLEVPDPRKRALLEAFAVGSLCPLHLGLGKSGAAP